MHILFSKKKVFFLIFLFLFIYTNPEVLAVESDIQVNNGLPTDGEKFDSNAVLTGANFGQFFSERNRYYLAIISSAVIGGVRCGSKCIVGGIVVGVADELLINAGIADKRYLSWGLLGATAGNIVSAGETIGVGVADLVGFTSGALVPTGLFNNHKELTVPLVSALAGKMLNILNSQKIRH